MLHFFKFNEDIAPPRPALDVYNQRGPGQGWPEECPPLRAANSFGWDVLAAFDMKFRQEGGIWKLENPQDAEADWLFHPDGADSLDSTDAEDGDAAGDDAAGGEAQGREGDEPEVAEAAPQIQRNAWFWDEEQDLPHRISPEVYSQIQNQVKVSSYLFLRSDVNELLYMTDIPNREKSYRALSAVVDTDWYPASYPWHCVLELDRKAESVTIERGEPICRLFLVRRDHYFAQEMTTADFERFFRRGQEWLRRYGRGDSPEMLDITRTYVKQQIKSTFSTVV